MYPIIVNLKGEIDFDGVATRTLDLRVFDFSELGVLHKCVTYFLGADLFGAWQGPDEKVASPEPEPVKRPPTPVYRSNSLLEPEEVLLSSSMWELERRANPWITGLNTVEWKVPNLPHDGIAKMKWVGCENEIYKRHEFISEEADMTRIAASEVPPVESVNFLGQQRKCTWSTHPVDG